MRLQSKRPLLIRGKLLGGPLPLICVPLVAADRDVLLNQARKVTRLRPDVIEWRVDKLVGAENTDMVLMALRSLREVIGNLPLILTCRANHEGGYREMTAGDRLHLYKAAAATGLVDLVDIELSCGEAMVAEVRDACRKADLRLILSYHNFEETPEKAFIFDRLLSAGNLGADVAKVAVMPQTYKDVLTLLSATYAARTERPDIPLITLSMGAQGVITRIAGGLFGSDLTFAAGEVCSAPGQIPIEDLRKAWSALSFR